MILGVLLWEMLFTVFLIMSFWSFFFSTKNIFALLMHAEFAIILLFFMFMVVSVYYSINILFGLSYLILILGGLELALNIILLLL